MKYLRRIVTNGKIFRIQCQDALLGKSWTFYLGDYKTLESARTRMEDMRLKDQEEENFGRDWTEVK